MTITSQNNVNECGICVINSLHNYFYHDNIKNQLLNDANFNTNGISILEFERLCSKYSIITETYEINIDELKNMQIKNYFVLILNTNNFLHYVIAKKIKNNKIIILDSLNGEYEITYDKLKEIFSNIIIFAKKSLIKNKPFLNRTWINLINTKNIFYNFLTQILISVFSILFGLFLNYILDTCGLNNNIKNIFIISSTFLIISILKHLFSFINEIITNNGIKQYHYYYKIEILKNIFKKEKNFFKKINKSNFYLINDSIMHICYFTCHSIPALLSNSVITFVCLILISVVNYYLLPLGIAILIANFFYVLFFLNKYTYFLNKNINIRNLINQNSLNYLTNFDELNNGLYIEKIKNEMNNNLNASLELHTKQNLLNRKVNVIINLTNDFIYVIATGIIIFLSWEKKDLNVGELLFTINTLIILFDSSTKIAMFMNEFHVLKKMKKIFDLFSEVGNIKNNSKIKPSKISSFSINGIHIKNNVNMNYKNLSYIVDIILNKSTDKNTSIEINNINTSNINEDWLVNNVCYFTNKSNIVIDTPNFNELVNISEITNFLKEFKFNFSENPKNKDIHILNTLSLLKQSNKLIIFDNYFKDFSTHEKRIIKKIILNKISSKNFVINNIN